MVCAFSSRGAESNCPRMLPSRNRKSEAGGGTLDLTGALDVSLEFRFLADGCQSVREEPLQFWGLAFKRVVHPFALSARPDETSAPQIGQMA